MEQNKTENGEYGYSKEDYLTPCPYEHLYKIADQAEQTAEHIKMADHAKSLGLPKKEFEKLWADFQKKWNEEKSAVSHVSNMEDQQIELYTGAWTLDNNGVWSPDGRQVCSHPIYPICINKNIETGDERIRIAYILPQGEQYTKSYETTVDPEILFSANSIVKLAPKGISVVSGKRAQQLAEFMRDTVDKNRAKLPRRSTVSHLGWARYNTFIPYDKTIKFDEQEDFNGMFRAFHQEGDYQVWKEEAAACMNHSREIRLIMAASFASVLIEPLNFLPFFVHLWSPESGTGKTVGLSLAASVWGDPSLTGEYVKSFKSTTVGFEIIAGFLHSLPMIIDELQVAAKDKNGNRRFNVYELGQGAGKSRGTKKLGLAPGVHWRNCILTSGETPLVQDGDGEGALNRVIELRCDPSRKIIENGNKTMSVVTANYGFAGEAFIEAISKDGIVNALKKEMDDFSDELVKLNVTDKQAMAAAIILTGYSAACRYVFQDLVMKPLTAEDIAGYLKTTDEVSLGKRGYEELCMWISRDREHFINETQIGVDPDTPKCGVYGKLVSESGAKWAVIDCSCLAEACRERHYDMESLISAFRVMGVIEGRHDGKTPYIYRTIGDGPKIKCVKFQLPDDHFLELDSDEALPFDDHKLEIFPQ